MGSYKRMLFLLIFVLTILTINVFASTYMDVTSPSPVNLDWGSTSSVSLTAYCNNDWCNCVCQYKVDSSSWNSLGTLNNQGGQVSFSVPVQAPSTNIQSQKQYTVQVYCQDSGFGCSSSDSNTITRYITVTYPTPATWSTYQAQQSAKSTASSDISAAQSLISQAQSSYNDAQNKIKEASNLGADVGSAQQYLNSADADLSSANSLLSNAQSSNSAGSYSTASNYATQAQQKASSVKNNAGLAKSTATSIIEEWSRLKTAAEGQIRLANTEIDTAKQRISAGEGIINNATLYGLDTAPAKAQIVVARSKIDSAIIDWKEATSIFNSATNKQSFENAKSQAQSAINLAKEAESIATQAYGELAKQVQIAGKAGEAIGSATTEISQMNEILTKLDYVVISTEKYGVNLAETKNVASTSKTNVDSSEDLLSQAKNNIVSGKYEIAANLAIQARDKAAAARNRLDTIAHTMSLSSQDALEKAYDAAKKKVADAESETTSAASTYGVTAELVVSAQNYIGQAKKSLEESKTHIDKVKTASGLSDQVKELDAAFKAIDETNKQSTNAINDAKSAKLGLYKKVAGVGAAAAGAAGGGFLYYRWRKKKKEKKEKKHEEKEEKPKEKKVKILSKLFKRKHKKEHEKDEEKHEHKKAEHEEHKKEEQHEEKEEKKDHKKSKFCGKCGNKVEGEKKFCPKCGAKLR